MQVLERKEVELRNEVATITRYFQKYTTLSQNTNTGKLFMFVAVQAAAEREGGREKEDEGGEGEAATGDDKHDDDDDNVDAATGAF